VKEFKKRVLRIIFEYQAEAEQGIGHNIIS
jgi:hypothetical protein